MKFDAIVVISASIVVVVPLIVDGVVAESKDSNLNWLSPFAARKIIYPSYWKESSCYDYFLNKFRAFKLDDYLDSVILWKKIEINTNYKVTFSDMRQFFC